MKSRKSFIYYAIACLISLLFIAGCGSSNNNYPSKDFSVIIASPGPSQYLNSESITFQGTATHKYYLNGEWHEYKIRGSDLIWTSSIDGTIGFGEEFKRKLTAGDHIITLTAIGYNDITNSTSISITIKQSIDE